MTAQDYGTYSFSGSMTAGGTITINGSIALQSPAASTPAAVGVTLDSVTITWTTDQPTDSLVTYGTTTLYGSSLGDATLTKTHSITLSGLDQGTLYHFLVISTNSHGLASSSGDNTFTTAAPPIISGLLVSNITTSTAVITWTTDQLSSSRLDYGSTESYGSMVSDAGMTTSHSITLTGLSELIKYHFQATSVTEGGIAAQTVDSVFWTRSSKFTATTLGDYGNVTVMEVAGNYDAGNADGTVNSLPRQEIAKEFFRTHQDDYDFFVVLSNFDFAMPDAESTAFYMGINNDTQGIGLEQFDNSASFASGMLQGMIDMGNIAGLGLSPLDPALFDDALNSLSHEQMHRWGAGVKFRNADGTLNASLLGRDGSHWSYLLDTDGSVLYGNDWQKNSDGTFTSISSPTSYGNLDLYLMGLIDRSQVSSITLIENASIDPAKLPEPGATITGTAKTVTIDDIIAAEGERVPDATTSQKTFKTAFILVTQPGTFAGTETEGIETMRNAWAGRFATLTGGKGSISDVASSLTVSITSPSDGATISGSGITVTGVVINSTGNETGVIVNGIPATVYGSRFIADYVSLTEGSNTITVTATDTAGNTATSTITVTAAAIGTYITVTSNIESGTAPITATLRVDGTFSITSTTITGSGPATPEITAISADEYSVKIKAEGTYTFTVSATGPDGSTYQDVSTIVVQSRTQMDNMLKAKWEGMKTALAAGNVEEAVSYFLDTSQESFRYRFTLLAAELPQVVADMGICRIVEVKEHLAEYDLRIENNGITYSYQVLFMKDRDGIWRIRSF
jgi:hypothetical protein